MNPNRFCFAQTRSYSWRPIRCSIYPLVCREEKKKSSSFFSVHAKEKYTRQKSKYSRGQHTHTRTHHFNG